MGARSTRRRRLGRDLVRALGPVVPGWSVAAERLHPYLGPLEQPVEASCRGVRMRLYLDDYVQRKIYYQAHEQGEARLVRRLVRPGDTVVDVGAHVGHYTLLFSTLVGPKGHVHAFEPVPANRKALTENIQLNHRDNVTVNPMAIGGSDGALTLSLPSNVLESGMSAMWRHDGDREGVDVPMIRLDDYIDEHLPGPIRLIKLDVEGMEVEALAGLSGALASGRPDALMIEIAEPFLSDPEPILIPLRSAGYLLRRIGLRGGLHPLNRPALAPRLVGLYYLLAALPGRSAETRVA